MTDAEPPPDGDQPLRVSIALLTVIVAAALVADRAMSDSAVADTVDA